MPAAVEPWPCQARPPTLIRTRSTRRDFETQWHTAPGARLTAPPATKWTRLYLIANPNDTNVLVEISRHAGTVPQREAKQTRSEIRRTAIGAKLILTADARTQACS